MWTVDYGYYTGVFLGAAVSETDWPRAIREACAYIDGITYGRLRGRGAAGGEGGGKGGRQGQGNQLSAHVLFHQGHLLKVFGPLALFFWFTPVGYGSGFSKTG